MFERALALTQFVSETTQRPPVHWQGIPTFIDQFRRILLRSATDTMGGAFIVHVEFALAKVDQLDVAIGTHHHVLGFEIAVDDGVGVQLA